MSYEKIKALTFDDKNRVIKITSTSSNVYPQNYYQTVWDLNDLDNDPHGKEYEERKRGAFEALLSGAWKFNPGVNSKVHYAFLRTLKNGLEKYKARGIVDFWFSNEWEHAKGKRLFDTEEELNNAKDDMFRKFKKLLSNRNSGLSNKHYIKLKDGRYVYKFTQYVVSVTANPHKAFTKLKALQIELWHNLKIEELIKAN